jgi:hypothetical protein
MAEESIAAPNSNRKEYPTEMTIINTGKPMTEPIWHQKQINQS